MSPGRIRKFQRISAEENNRWHYVHNRGWAALMTYVVTWVDLSGRDPLERMASSRRRRDVQQRFREGDE